MHVRPFVERDFLAAQLRDGSNARILRHDDGFGVRRGRLRADIDEIDARGLRENRRRLADRADIDRARIEAFEQLRPGREFEPLHGDALRGETLVERAARLEHHEVAVLLIADAQRFRRIGGARDA